MAAPGVSGDAWAVLKTEIMGGSLHVPVTDLDPVVARVSVGTSSGIGNEDGVRV